jgi:hypothetical protein
MLTEPSVVVATPEQFFVRASQMAASWLLTLTLPPRYGPASSTAKWPILTG